MNRESDLTYIEMAYGLAEKARGRTSPNPCVGAVIVKGSRIVGVGYHEEAGSPHAEIVALARAGVLAKGATLYVTLEPCVHWGRTPPCVDSLIRSGLKRVVISAIDPNPLVNGRGIRALKKAGIQVSLGLLGEKNQKLNEAYNKYIVRKIPFITLKAALSLDGRIATKRADSKWISSAAAREYIHLIRGENDAILIGSGTLLRDNPRLTIRHLLWEGKRLTRVILDSRLRISLKAKILSSSEQGDILIFAGNPVSGTKARALEARGVEIIRLPHSTPGAGLKDVLKELGSREIATVLVEGGGRVLTSFIEQKLADKVLLTLSPRLIGGKTALSFLEGKGTDFIKNSLPVKEAKCFAIGGDWIIEGYL